ncbi:MAG: glycosyltransferase [Lachnospiraceae bacterium]|nr:glycosyltransferase [Lachnospiraceae bacterium]
MLLSVVVPVYNVDKAYLSECFESILGQSMTDYELIIVDDGADAGIGKYIDDYDFREAEVKIIHQENTGVAGARNRALDACSGKYVTFVDSDDTITPDCFEKITDFAEKNSLEVLMFGLYRVTGSRRVQFLPYTEDIGHFSKEQKEEVQLKVMVGILPFFKCPPASADAAGSACAKLYLRSFLEKNSLRYIQGLKRAEDMEFNLRVFDRAEHIGNLNGFYYFYRQITTSATYVYRPGGIDVFTASLNAMKDHLTAAGKSDLYMQVFYMRCMFFFLESMDMDYLNPANPLPFKERIRSLGRASHTEPYAEAFSNLRTQHLTFARRIPLFLIRHGMFTLLAMFYSVYARLQRQ